MERQLTCQIFALLSKYQTKDASNCAVLRRDNAEGGNIIRSREEVAFLSWYELQYMMCGGGGDDDE